MQIGDLISEAEVMSATTIKDAQVRPDMRRGDFVSEADIMSQGTQQNQLNPAANKIPQGPKGRTRNDQQEQWQFADTLKDQQNRQKLSIKNILPSAALEATPVKKNTEQDKDEMNLMSERVHKNMPIGISREPNTFAARNSMLPSHIQIQRGKESHVIEASTGEAPADASGNASLDPLKHEGGNYLKLQNDDNYTRNEDQQAPQGIQLQEIELENSQSPMILVQKNYNTPIEKNKCYTCETVANVTCTRPDCKNNICNQHGYLDGEDKTWICASCQEKQQNQKEEGSGQDQVPKKSKLGWIIFALFLVIVIATTLGIVLGTQGKDDELLVFKEEPDPEPRQFFNPESVNRALVGFYEQPQPPRAVKKAIEDYRRTCIVPPPLSIFKDRPLIHISTDKPFYRPGEILFIEAFFIDAISKKPMYARQDTQYPQLRYEDPQWNQVRATAKVYDGQDKVVHEFKQQYLYNGTVVFNSWRIPKDQNGGEYKIQVQSQSYSTPKSFRKIRIGAFSNPSLFATLDFDKNAYTASDQVVGKVKVRRPDGEKLPFASSIAYTVSSDTSPQDNRQNILLNDQGEAQIQFSVPNSNTMKVMTVSLQTYLGYSQEDKSSPPDVSTFSVPLLDDDFEVDFFPQFSSSLVSHLKNKIYFQVSSKPSDTQSKKQHIEFYDATLGYEDNSFTKSLQQDIKHEHNGRSSFSFVPQIGRAYQLLVKRTKSSNPKKFNLPQTNLTDNVMIQLNKTAFNSSDKNIIIKVLTSQHFKSDKHHVIQVMIYNKENMLVDYNVTMTVDGNNEKTVSIPMSVIYNKTQNGGVLILKARSIETHENKTVVTQKLERLIFVYPTQTLDMKVTTQKLAYEPGDLVEIKISVDKPKNLQESEYLYASIMVSDLSSFLKVDKASQHPTLQQMVYLEKEIEQMNKEVDEFKYSNDFLFQANNSNLENLLGCQGWRRFKLDDLDQLRNEIAQKIDKEFNFQYLLGERGQQIIVYDDVMYKKMAGAGAGNNTPFQERMAVPAAAQAEAAPGPAEVIKNRGPPSPAGDKQEADEHSKFATQDVLSGRRYVHPLRKDFSKISKREDFTQTLLFNSALQLQDDPADPTKLVVSQKFFLNDQVSQFVIQVNAFSSEGKYGYQRAMLTSTKTIYSDFQMPETFVQGDEFQINFKTQYNLKEETNATVYYIESRDGQEYNKTQPQTVTFKNKNVFDFKYSLNTSNGFYQNLSLAAKVEINGTVFDFVEKTAKVVMDGFEQQVSLVGILGVSTKVSVGNSTSGNSTVSNSNTSNSISSSNSSSLLPMSIKNTINLPNTTIGQPQFRLVLASTTFDSILGAIKSLIKNPSGCFEQTSATTYPMVMALQLLTEIRKQYEVRADLKGLQEVDDMIKEIREKLEVGYKKLISFETSSKGYEWFGTSPGHEALTSYGIMQFTQMKDVVTFVDDSTIQRNSDWLMKRRKNNGSGQFNLNQKALDTFGRASQDVTDAYIMWVLTSMKGYDQNNLGDELKNLERIARDSFDPYILSLSIGAFFNVENLELARKYADRVGIMQNSTSGVIEGAKTSITASRGNNLLVETTSLAVINWLNIDSSKYAEKIDLSIGFLMKSVKDGGRYGSTQATVLCLQALVKYAQVFGGIKGSGRFVLSVNGTEISSHQFNQEAQMINNVDFSYELNKYFKDNQPQSPFEVQVSIMNYNYNNESQGFRLSYHLQTTFVDRMPKSPAKPAIKFEIKSDKILEEVVKNIGQIQKQELLVENISNQSQGMTVAMLSVPACMVVELAQLELLKKDNKMDHYEISADNTLITFYWTYLKNNEQKRISLSRTVKYGGEGLRCLERANKAFLYYDDDNEVWVK